jgi:hypothetical protein
MISESPVKCLECRSSNWERVYSNEELEKFDDLTQFNLMKEVKCLDCGFHWSLSTMDIVRHFIYLRKKEGKSRKDINNEISNNLNDLLKRL